MSNARDYLTNGESVQVRYRPVVQLARLPEVPEEGDVDSPAALWWTEQHKRCRKGWTAPDGVWFNPIYYWYLNFCTIEYVDPITKRELIEPPLYIDSDHEIFNAIWFCLSFSMPREVMEKLPGKSGRWSKPTKAEKAALEKRRRETQAMREYVTLQAKDLICTKGRRKHWSFITFCAVLPWLWCVDPAGHIGAGFDEKSSREEGQRIFRGVYDRLHPFWQHEKLYTDREGELSPMLISYDDDGNKIEKEGWTIYFRELDRRPGALRGKRYRLIILDEAGKYLNLKKVLGSLKDCLRVGTDKFGTLLLGGTFDSITVEDDSFQKTWEDAPFMGWVRLFIAAWKCAPNEAKTSINWFTGESIEDIARADYMRERQMFIDAGNMEGYAFCVQESPLDEWELFSAPSQSQYPAHLMIEQTQRIAELKQEERVLRGRLQYAVNGYGMLTNEVEFVEDPNGYWWIHPDGQPEPEFDDLDVMGVDDVYKDLAPHSKSLCGISIRRRFDHRLPSKSGMHIAIYEYRPMMDDFATECIMAIKFWGGTRKKSIRVIVEDNAKFTSDKLIDAGFGDNLIWYSQQPGLRNSDSTIIAQTGLMLSWVKRGMRLCRFQRIIDGLKKWRQQNDDVASADHLAIMGESTVAAMKPADPDDPNRPKPSSQSMIQKTRLKAQLSQTDEKGRMKSQTYRRALQARERQANRNNR